MKNRIPRNYIEEFCFLFENLFSSLSLLNRRLDIVTQLEAAIAVKIEISVRLFWLRIEEEMDSEQVLMMV